MTFLFSSASKFRSCVSAHSSASVHFVICSRLRGAGAEIEIFSAVLWGLYDLKVIADVAMGFRMEYYG